MRLLLCHIQRRVVLLPVLVETMTTVRMNGPNSETINILLAVCSITSF
jgi:hypothetical protein